MLRNTRPADAAARRTTPHIFADTHESMLSSLVLLVLVLVLSTILVVGLVGVGEGVRVTGA
jgi:hypothetical protein